MSSLEPVEVYRTTFSKVVAIVVAVVCLLGLVASAVGRPATLLDPGWVLGCVAIVVWVLFWWPRVEISDGEIVIANVLRTHRVPWVRVTAIDSRWAFTVHTSDRAYQAWASPGSSGMAARARLTRSRRDEERESLHGADADAVALAAAQRMEALKAAGHLGTPRDDIPTRSRWNLAPLAMLAVAAAWAVAGLLA